MPTKLMRRNLRECHERAIEQMATVNPHPGLLVQRGLGIYDQDTENGREAKTRHLRTICAIPTGDFYQHAYARWRAATANQMRFRQVEMELISRLFMGLSGGGMLETGCTLSHSYGAPYIPGSSIKGVVRGYVRGLVRGTSRAEAQQEVINELFGVDAKPDDPQHQGLSGIVSFHDAWWVPGSAPVPNEGGALDQNRPLVEEVVTTHHPAYYSQEGADPASDTDSPIPNAQIAVRGRFLFVLEGPPAWLDLAARMLVGALANHGLGAKTRTGYGLFNSEIREPSELTCAWVDETLRALMVKNKATNDDTLRGRPLAAAWEQLSDPDLKATALADIRKRWLKKGWWDEPPGKAAKQAKAIYEPST